jgi:hypothetical protein
MSELITINDIMRIAEYKLYTNMKRYGIENEYQCIETEEYDKFTIKLSNKFNCKINYPLKATYNKDKFKELIKEGYIVNKIHSRLFTNEFYTDLELKSIILDKENISLYVYYYSYDNYIIDFPETFKEFNFEEIILDKENSNIITLQNLPNNMKKLCINYNSIVVEFQRSIYEIMHTNNIHNYTLLNEPVKYIREIDYNILSPSGNLKYIELPDIIIHHNKLINLPEDVIIKTYSYQLYIFDFWECELQDYFNP